MEHRLIIPQEQNLALRQEAKEIPVAEIQSQHTQTLIADMKHLLKQEKLGVALAAPQVGESLRLFVVSGRSMLKDDKEDTATPPPDQVYINPSFIKLSRSKKDRHEGCLSVRGWWGVVPRSEKVTIQAYDETGKHFTRGASGLLAHIFQHEMDHLEGILYTDKVVEIYPDKGEDAEL